MMNDEIKKKIKTLIDGPNSTENTVEYIESLNMTSSEITDILLEVSEYIAYEDIIDMYYLVQERANTFNLTEEEFLECIIYELEELLLKIQKACIFNYFSVAFIGLIYFMGVYSLTLFKVLGVLTLILVAILSTILIKYRGKTCYLITEFLYLNDCLPKIRQIASKWAN